MEGIESETIEQTRTLRGLELRVLLCNVLLYVLLGEIGVIIGWERVPD